ncbi:MAG TPA: hypothetical protein VJR47_06470 [Stellaceae bacterium]|nr:hypothetical protein [Stellaceae bacterium]
MSDASLPDGTSAVIVGLARDCARDLPAALRNLETMAACFARAAFVIAENDSADGTAEILGDFAARRGDARLLNFDGIDKRLPQWTRRLAFLRNQCLAAIRADARLRASDYLIIADLDDAMSEPLDRAAFVRALEFLAAEPDRAGVFANCRGPYYDLWALRHPALCPGDVWEEAFDYALARGADDATAYAATVARRMLTIATSDPPLAVASAFGGLGIYKLRFIQDAVYKGFKPKEIAKNGLRRAIKWQVCEHVAFNEAIGARGGKLFILPFLINRRIESVDFVNYFHRLLVF